MGEIVNLRRARKRKLDEERLATAAEQRVRHGRSKSERTLDRDRLAREQARLAGHRLEPVGSEPAPQDGEPAPQDGASEGRP